MAKPLPAPVRTHWTGLRILLLFTVVCGLAYPLLVTGISQAAFPHQANGSLLKNSQGQVVGSSLIGQQFTGARWFQSRPSVPNYDPTASGGSNKGTNDAQLAREYRVLKQQIATFNRVPVDQVPPDAITSSGSGLDPDISPQYAAIQVDRVAESRGLSPDAVRALVARYTQGRTAGFLGEPRVDVLRLNLALEKLS